MRTIILFLLVLFLILQSFAQTNKKLSDEVSQAFVSIPTVLFEGVIAEEYSQGRTLLLPYIDMTREFEYFEDQKSTLQFSDVVRPKNNKTLFIPYPAHQSLDPNSVYWFRVKFRNESSQKRTLLVQCNSRFDRVDLHTKDSKGRIGHQISGQKVAPPSKNIMYPMGQNVFLQSFPANTTLELYFKVGRRNWIGSGWQDFPKFKLRLYNWAFIQADLSKMRQIDILYLGIFLAFSIYHLLLYASSREREYFYYAASIAFITLWNATDRLVLYDFVSGFWAYSILKPLAIFGSAYFLMRFTDVFLNLKNHQPLAHLLLSRGQWLLWIIPLYTFLKEIWQPIFLKNYADTIHVLFESYEMIMGVFYLGLVIFTSFRLSHQGYPPARYYFYSFTLYFMLILCLYGLIYLGKEEWISLNLLKISLYLNYFNIGSNALILFVFSLAIGDKMNRLQKDKLEAARENLLLQQNANQLLDKKVSERTVQLKKANESLKIQNNRLEDLNEELTALNDEKDNLIKIVAHNLGTPLAANNMYLGLLRKHGHNLQEDQHEYLSTVAESNQNLITMINRILDISSMEAKGIILRPEAIHLKSTLEEIVKKLNSIAQKKNITISRDYQGTQSCIWADKSYFCQIIENLLGNAIKFSEFSKNIYLSTHLQGTNIQISVRDEGPGIKAEDRKKMFKIYQMLSAKPTAGENSTGLGLYIVKKYTEALGGIVWEEGQEGKGANFILQFELMNDPQT
ncbi:MAG: sensor histidine kinase [Microscillaceae bacterium]|nr:sensor histidine kinase [Microscillaceae bacterium]